MSSDLHDQADKATPSQCIANPVRGFAGDEVRGKEGLLLQDAGQGLPADCAADAAPAASAYDLAAIRLQRRVPWVLPLLDQAVVCVEARVVLPAHGPRVPDSCPPLRSRGALRTSRHEGGSRLRRRSE